MSSASSANFQPSYWGDYFINVTTLNEASKVQMELEVGNLKEEVKKELLSTVDKPTSQLEIIDATERLGVAYHFDKDIEEAINQFYETYIKEHDTYSLYHAALGFRILRQHGFNVSCDVLKRFTTDKGLQGCISNDLKGILSLYEASHFRILGDDMLEDALEFTTTYLKSLPDELKSNPMADQVAHALDQPIHTGMIRLESKHYISFYEHDPSHNKTLLRLAKLDFNLLQSSHLLELRDFALWWKDVHAKVPFTRDRSVECYFWVLGCYYEPKYALARKIFTRMFMVIQLFDDIFDSHGTIEEKQLLVEAVHRWDYSFLERLPNFFQYCYKILLDTFGEIEEDLAKEGRSFCMHYSKEKMKVSCEAWFQEVKWCKAEYIPTYEEYMEVATASVGQTAAIISAYLGMGDIATREAFEWVFHNPEPKFIKACSIILRLMNDIGGHKFEQDREHVASSVECCMKQYGISDEVQVYDVLERQVKDAWKDINEGMLKPHAIPKVLLDRVCYLARLPDIMYRGRTEGYTFANKIIQKKIASVLIDPVPL